jgi:hypothetical protein
MWDLEPGFAAVVLIKKGLLWVLIETESYLYSRW